MSASRPLHVSKHGRPLAAFRGFALLGGLLLTGGANASENAARWPAPLGVTWEIVDDASLPMVTLPKCHAGMLGFFENREAYQIVPFPEEGNQRPLGEVCGERHDCWAAATLERNADLLLRVELGFSDGREVAWIQLYSPSGPILEQPRRMVLPRGGGANLEVLNELTTRDGAILVEGATQEDSFALDGRQALSSIPDSTIFASLPPGRHLLESSRKGERLDATIVTLLPGTTSTHTLPSPASSSIANHRDWARWVAPVLIAGGIWAVSASLDGDGIAVR